MKVDYEDLLFDLLKLSTEDVIIDEKKGEIIIKKTKEKFKISDLLSLYQQNSKILDI